MKEFTEKEIEKLKKSDARYQQYFIGSILDKKTDNKKE